MKKLTILLLTLSGLLPLIFCSLQAQPGGIAIKLISYNITPNNVANIGYTITISTEVTNEDSVGFSGTLDFGLRNNQFVITDPNVFNKPWFSGSQTITLGGFETVPAVFSVEIDAQYFAPGPDVVVVWPISNKPISDSVLININVQDPTGLEQSDEIPFAYFLQNNKITFSYDQSEVNFKQVRLFDIFGRLLSYQSADLISELQWGTLPHGLYLCEIVTKDKKRRTLKLIL